MNVIDMHRSVYELHYNIIQSVSFAYKSYNLFHLQRLRHTLKLPIIALTDKYFAIAFPLDWTMPSFLSPETKRLCT